MTHFTGLCTFPHGACISAALLLAACAALTVTAYSVASCRIMVLSFSSVSGTFEQSFSRFNPVQTESLVQYKVALGLFQWLKPDADGLWDDGTCVGYQEGMKEKFSDLYFEVARSSGSMAVLLGVLVFLWAVVNSCMAWNVWQITMLALLLISTTAATALSFIVIKSDLCANVFAESSCTFDEGGLLLISGAVLWFSAFLITVLFMRTLDRRVADNGLSDLERARAREMSLLKVQRLRERERQQRQRAEARDRNLLPLVGAGPENEPREQARGGKGRVVETPSTVHSLSQSVDNDEAGGHDREIATAASLPPSKKPWHSRMPRRSRSPEVKPPTIVNDHAEQDEYEVYINTRRRRIGEILKEIRGSEDPPGLAPTGGQSEKSPPVDLDDIDDDGQSAKPPPVELDDIDDDNAPTTIIGRFRTRVLA